MSGVKPTAPSARFDYDVFISYRSCMFPDKPVAETLQRVLETFPIPGPLKKNVVAPGRWRSRLKVFRDITDLNASSDLNEALKEKLRRSRYLIVICTPNIPKSPYCTEEIRYFREYHGHKRVLPLLVQGEPSESFPETLISFRPKQEPSEDSSVAFDTTKDPLAADVRAESKDGILKKLKGKGVPKAQQARFKLLAPILGCQTPDDLIQRDRARYRRQVATYTSVVLLLVLGFSAVIYAQYWRYQIRQAASEIMDALSNDEYPTEDEYVALDALAESVEAVRMEFVEQLMASEDKAERLRPRFPHIVHAVVGLDLRARQRLRTLLLGHGKDPSETETSINIARAELGFLLDVNDSDFSEMIASNYVAAMEGTTDLDELDSLCTALAGLDERLPAEQAAAGARQIVAAMEKAADPVEVRCLATALGSLSEKLTLEQAAARGQQIVAVMEETTDPDALESLAGALGKLGEKTPAEQATAGAQHIIARIESWTNDNELLEASFADMDVEILKYSKSTPEGHKAIIRTFLGSFREILETEYTDVSQIKKDTRERAMTVIDDLKVIPNRKSRELWAQAYQRFVRWAETSEEFDADTVDGWKYALTRMSRVLAAPVDVDVEEEILDAPPAPRRPVLDALADDAPFDAVFADTVLVTLASALWSLGERLPAEHAAAEAQRIAAAMEGTSDPYALSSLGRALGSFGEKLPAEQASAGARQIVAAMEKTRYWGLLESLGRGLTSLGEKLPAEQASAVAQPIMAAMERTTGSDSLYYLAGVLGSLGAKLPAEQSNAAARQIVAAMEKATDPYKLRDLSLALGSLGDKLSAEQAATGSRQIVDAMEKTSDPYKLRDLGLALGSLVKQLPAEQASAVAQRIVAVMEKTTDPEELSSLASALGSLGDKLSAEQAATGSRQIVDAMEKTSDPYKLRDLGLALGSLVKQLPAEQASAVAQRIVAVMEKTTDPEELSSLASALGSLGDKLSAEHAATGSRQVVDALERTADPYRLSSLCSALGSLGMRLPADQVAALAQKIAVQMERTTNPDALRMRGSALHSLGERLPAEQAAAGAQQIVAFIGETTDSDDLSTLGSALESLVVNLKPEDIIAILKSLVCVSDTRDNVLAGLKKKTGQNFDGSLWKAVEWAESQGIDVGSIPRWPIRQEQ